MELRRYRISDEASVIGLWREFGLVRPWNDPSKDIQRKLTVQPEMFVVGIIDDKLVASVMAGFDGHRGWINYLAVAQQYRRCGFGRALIQRVEHQLKELGCPKLNIQVRVSNTGVLSFYRELGYAQEDIISLGKRLISDERGAT